MQQMQVVPSGGQICNLCKWFHVVAKFIPSHGVNFWVCCASGNVYMVCIPHHLPLQCGTASSCVKISRPTNMFDSWGHFVPPDERRPPETLFRGCFVLDLKQDICYNARDGLRYCWCSRKDLCNASPPRLSCIKIILFFSLVGQNVKGV